MAGAYDFPRDLLSAQEELHQVAAALTALLEGLPWCVEPHPGFSDPDIWRPRQRELTITVVTHPFWAAFEGPDLVTARMQLKHTHAAAPAA
ncbi:MULTISPECIES: hypothetical protein [Streptomyces]|uniref:hypothetical protein n=1 Tax=Streptomyces lycopersici TaxID=2974589 RepID=UPI0021CEAD4F|nr:hypothetical protein [Streptomyces sp. NEAU-383]